jgi:hypothetical protein
MNIIYVNVTEITPAVKIDTSSCPGIKSEIIVATIIRRVKELNLKFLSFPTNGLIFAEFVNEQMLLDQKVVVVILIHN